MNERTLEKTNGFEKLKRDIQRLYEALVKTDLFQQSQE